MLLLFIFLLCALCLHADAHSPRQPYSASQNVHQPLPTTKIDNNSPASLYYDNLDPMWIHEQWSASKTSTLREKLRSLEKFQLSLFLDVQLVGFDGDGDVGVRVSPSQLQTALDAAAAATQHRKAITMRVVKARQNLMQKVKDTISQYVLNEIRTVLPTLKQPKDARKFPALPVVTIPHALVDDIIAAEFDATSLSYTVFLLNTPAVYWTFASKLVDNTTVPELRTRIKYVYTSPSADRRSPSSLASSNANACPAVLHVARKRYTWLDMSAGPLTMGPHTWGDGIVTEFAIPKPQRLREQQRYYIKMQFIQQQALLNSNTPPQKLDFTQMKVPAQLSSHFMSQLVSEMATFLHKAMSHLFLRPIAPLPPPLLIDERASAHDQDSNDRNNFDKITLEFIYIHEDHEGYENRNRSAMSPPASLSFPSSSSPMSESERVAEEQRIWNLFPDQLDSRDQASVWKDWYEIQQELKSLPFSSQSLEIINRHFHFSSCPLCTSSYTHSLRSHTSNVYNGALAQQIVQFLDAEEMRDWMEHFEEQEKDGGKIREHDGPATTTSTERRTVRVFIYDLANPNILLFDRFHQSIAFPSSDLVLSVQSRASSAIVDFQCNGENMSFDPRDASRATLSSILQAVWGIVPTHVRAKQGINAKGINAITINTMNGDSQSNTEHDYLFSTGYTPFGPFSSSKQLSFAIKDSVSRNIISSELNSTLSSLISLFHHFFSSATSPSVTVPTELIDHMLTTDAEVDFARRFALFQLQLEKIQHYYNLNQFETAYKYVKAAKHDAFQLWSRMKHSISSKLKLKLNCELQAPPSKEENTVLAATSSNPSLTSLLNTLSSFISLIIQLSLLLFIIFLLWFLSHNSHRIWPLFVRCLPTSLIQRMGWNTTINSKYKHWD